MTFEITTYVEVNINEIINNYKINNGWSIAKIRNAVLDYISGFDDCEYYLLYDNINEIVDEVKKEVK